MARQENQENQKEPEPAPEAAAVPRDPVVLQKALAYLHDHVLLTMATSNAAGVPNATCLEYATENPVVYVTSRRASWKVKNLEENPRVMYEVHDDVDIRQFQPGDAKQIKGLQVLASARILEHGTPAFEHAWEVCCAKFPIFRKMPPTPARCILAFDPQRLWFLDYGVKFGHRDEYVFRNRGHIA